MPKVTRDQWIEDLKGLERDFAFKVGGRSDIKITVLIDDIPVSKFHDDTQHLEILTQEQKYLTEIKDCLERSRAISILCQFNPATTFDVRVSGSMLEFSSTKISVQKISTDGDWSDWFFAIRQNLAVKVHFIPDTNFIMHHYYSMMKSRMKDDKFKQLHFVVPRLVLLEIEAIYNRTEQDAERDKRKRLAFNTMREVLLMRNNGADLLPPLTSDLFDGFSKVAGKGFADPLIRTEVSRYRDSVLHGGGRSADVIFLTRDLMSSMMATAENIHSMYMVRNDTGKYFLSYEEFTDFIIDLAIMFGSCKIKTETQSQVCEQDVEGIWSGKTMNEWLNGTLNVSA